MGFWYGKILSIWLLAATSSSKSDVVTNSIRPSVRLCVCVLGRPFFFLLVSLKSVEHLECNEASKSFKGIQWKLMCVSRVLRVFQGCIKGVSRTFQENFKGVSGVFQGCFKEVSRKFQGSFKVVSRMFQ